MSAIVRWCLANKSVVVLATLLLVGGGGYAATQLNQELLPDIEFPVVTVATPVPGAGPELVDEQVTQELEGAVEGVGNVDSVRSTSSQGFSFVAVEFGLDADAEAVRDDLQRELEGVELPEQAGEPEIETQSADSFPILNISLATGDERDLTALTGYARDEVVPLLEDVDGTGEVELAGGSEGRVRVDLDPGSLEEAGLPPEAVAGAIAEAESEAPAGDVEIEGFDTPVVVQSGVRGVESLRDLALGAPGGAPGEGAPEGAPAEGDVPEGAPEGEVPEELAEEAPEEPPEPVLLGDVAGVEEVEENIGGISRTNGEPSLGINVSKEPGANTVEVAEGVEEALGEVREELGEDQVLVVFNSADDIEASVDGLIEKALLGAAFAVAVIFGFLRSVRATLVTAVSLPTSVLAALLFSWGDGLTLNILTLAGLTIAVGRVVDDSIVVLENSYRYIGEGLDPETAALKGTTEVASAITSSTLCTAAVFLPIGLVGGIVSEFFLPLSLTVAFALLASLLVAVTLIPVLVSLFLSRGGGETGRPGLLRRLLGGRGGGDRSGDGLLVRLYTPALRWSLGHRFVVLLAALGIFVGGLAAAFFLPASFFPPSEARLLVADVELPDGTVLEESAGETRAFEEFLIGDPAVESYQLSVGGEDSLGGGFASSQRGDDEAQAFISVREGSGVNAALERIEERGDELFGGGNFGAEIQEQGPPAGGLEITVTGGSNEELAEASETVVDEVSGTAGVANLESDLSGGGEQISVQVDNGAAAGAGLSPGSVAQSLGTLLGGEGGPELTLGETPVSVGVPEGTTGSVEEVEALPLGAGASVGDVAEVARSGAPSTVSRADGERAVTVTGEITGEDTNAVSGEVGETLAALDLPGEVTATLGGESEDIAESFRDLFISIAVALALVYLILVVFFRSLLVPLVILLAVPLTTVGAFGALLLTGTALSVPALLGVLLLIGIVVANSILLIDFVTNAERRSGSLHEAIVDAGRARLRPILMTALVTVFALLPLALGLGEGSTLISSSLAIPVIGGLLTSTFLTLLVVPVGYSVLGSLRRGRVARGDRRAGEKGP